MLKSISFSHAMAALLVVCAFASCKKDDTVPPVVSLIGGSSVEVFLGSTFTDPGATATDDVDGDLSAEVTVSGTVNTTSAGAYTLTYSVSDAAGNTGTATRTVNVVVTRDNYLGTFACVENCPSPYGLSSSSPISAGAGADQIVITPFYFNGGSLTLTVDGNDVTVDAGQNPNPLGEAVTGSGTMNADATVMTLNLTFTPQSGTPQSCVATYTKN